MGNRFQQYFSEFVIASEAIKGAHNFIIFICDNFIMLRTPQCKYAVYINLDVEREISLYDFACDRQRKIVHAIRLDVHI